MTEQCVRLPADAVVVQRVVPRLLWLRFPLCVALTPTLACGEGALLRTFPAVS